MYNQVEMINYQEGSVTRGLQPKAELFGSLLPTKEGAIIRSSPNQGKTANYHNTIVSFTCFVLCIAFTIEDRGVDETNVLQN